MGRSDTHAVISEFEKVKKKTDKIAWEDYIRLEVIPPHKVHRSIDGRIQPQEAIHESLAAGIPEECLRKFSVSIRHTHARINTIVLELPKASAADLERYLQDNRIRYERVLLVTTCSSTS